MNGTYIESHPRDRLVFGDGGSLDHLQTQSLIVKFKREYCTRRRPCPYHQVMLHFVEDMRGK
jgi:hypothetical protein